MFSSLFHKRILDIIESFCLKQQENEVVLYNKSSLQQLINEIMNRKSILSIYTTLLDLYITNTEVNQLQLQPQSQPSYDLSNSLYTFTSDKNHLQALKSLNLPSLTLKNGR